MTKTYRVPPIHTQRNETSPWDGCWCFALAEGVDAATGGAILLTEAQIRWASYNPDHAGVSDGGNIADQLQALRKLASKVRIKAYPSAAELRAHLAAGNGAVLSGFGADVPIIHRKVDPRFYSRPRLMTGHGTYVQGTGAGDGKVHWMDPLLPAGAKPPVYPIAAAVIFAWGSSERKIAILVWPALLNTAPAPPADRVRVKGSWWDYDITGSRPNYDIGRVSRATVLGWSADLEPSRIGSAAEPFVWGGRERVFAKVATGAWIGSWVDLTGAPNVTHIPA